MKTTTASNSKQSKNLKGPCIDFMFAYAEQNIEKMLHLCDPEGIVAFQPMGENGKGTIGELGKTIWLSLIECFPNITNVVHSAVKEADNIQCKVLISGTQAKDFAGIISKGNTFQSDHIFVFKLNDNNKIENIQVVWNHADFQRQLEK